MVDQDDEKEVERLAWNIMLDLITPSPPCFLGVDMNWRRGVVPLQLITGKADIHALQFFQQKDGIVQVLEIEIQF